MYLNFGCNGGMNSLAVSSTCSLLLLQQGKSHQVSSDASKHAYTGCCLYQTQGNIHVALVTSKIMVAPIKQLTTPRLELSGAQLLAQMLGHNVREVLQISLKYTFG